MIGTAATDIVQEVQSEVDAGATMRTEAGSQGTRKTKKHGGTGDGRDRGRWRLGMTEMKSDAEWVDPTWYMHHPQHLFPSRVRRVF